MTMTWRKIAALVFLVALVGAAYSVAAELSAPAFRSDEEEVSSDEPVAPSANAVPPARDELRVSTRGWKTDFTKHTVPLREFRGGGPGRDGIPPIDRPKFETVTQADAWLKPLEPLIHLQVGGDARAYPIQVLMWHEIVNDEVGGVPVAVTFCPLCNTAIVFDRRLDGQTLDFGTSGNLRNSDLVMWDRQTESWWQQAGGDGVVGELAGKRLEMLPASIISWADFRQLRPQASVLSRDTGYNRDYGRNPYVGYDRIDQSPFLFEGKLDGRLRPMERVVAVSLGGEDVAYPFSLLSQRYVIADRVGGQPLVVFWQAGAASALDAAVIPGGRDVGGTGVYVPEVDSRSLTFTWRDGAFVDAETGSRWTILGEATSGPLAGKRLEPVVHADYFWFSWGAFKPNTRIFQ